MLFRSPKPCSFTKEERFHQHPPDNNAKFLGLPSCLSNRYSNFGFGERTLQKSLPGIGTPDPAHYNYISVFDTKVPALNKGKSFGISRSFYDNVYAPNQEHMSPEAAKKLPGPNQYSPLPFNSFDHSSKKITIGCKIPPLEPTTKSYPGPGAHAPNYSLTEQARYTGAGLGYGNRGSPV